MSARRMITKAVVTLLVGAASLSLLVQPAGATH
jgi:hypothetical protein